ncbi:MAG: hypothetical protein NT172_19210 [Planctomycetota bacterium]|nr:hypothetical protein [Planctomycetota bacterium]
MTTGPGRDAGGHLWEGSILAEDEKAQNANARVLECLVQSERFEADSRNTPRD